MYFKTLAVRFKALIKSFNIYTSSVQSITNNQAKRANKHLIKQNKTYSNATILYSKGELNLKIKFVLFERTLNKTE